MLTLQPEKWKPDKSLKPKNRQAYLKHNKFWGSIKIAFKPNYHGRAKAVADAAKKHCIGFGINDRLKSCEWWYLSSKMCFLHQTCFHPLLFDALIWLERGRIILQNQNENFLVEMGLVIQGQGVFQYSCSGRLAKWRLPLSLLHCLVPNFSLTTLLAHDILSQSRSWTPFFACSSLVLHPV